MMAIAGVTVSVCAAVVAAIAGLAVVRRRLRGGLSGTDVAVAQRRRLVANWRDVEQAALLGGMTPDEIAAVRERLLG